MEVFNALVRPSFNFLGFGVILRDCIALRNQFIKCPFYELEGLQIGSLIRCDFVCLLSSEVNKRKKGNEDLKETSVFGKGRRLRRIVYISLSCLQGSFIVGDKFNYMS
ncbi:hypothetical protein ES332_A08G238300v1 [Gossypium tomentosum]|uniref:Uncharacterized protein n=1 Tax=Gossypium tomentosum TaxID=34277 RepID=A0A5D2PJR9_GOSTO|nr:hypothetical protein ES332_A08G238300v1 [Gossypium tomentosum]